jgi:hypothetical protein
MASSSKGRAFSRKQSSAGKARVISTKRKDALPRTGSVSAGRGKPVVLAPIDGPTEPPPTAVAAPKKKAHTLQQIAVAARRKKTTRAAGRAPAKLDEPAPAAIEVAQAEAAVPDMVDVAAPAPASEEFAVTAVEAPQVEALAVGETEFEVEASAIVEELPFETATAPSIAIGPPPLPEATRAPPTAPHHERRSLKPAISRLLSTLSRWTGVSGTK